MWVKLVLLAPQELFALGLAITSTAYLQWWIRRQGPQFWTKEWRRVNQWKLVAQLISPAALLWGPSFEELLFRLPLIVFFDKITPLAVGAILLSNVLFVLEHLTSWVGPGFVLPPSEQRRGYNMEPKPVPLLKIYLMGVVLGFLAVYCQSLVLVVGVHMLANLVGISTGVYSLYARQTASN